eukprot:766054-Hanusia_phi.AAC.2
MTPTSSHLPSTRETKPEPRGRQEWASRYVTASEQPAAALNSPHHLLASMPLRLLRHQVHGKGTFSSSSSSPPLLLLFSSSSSSYPLLLLLLSSSSSSHPLVVPLEFRSPTQRHGSSKNPHTARAKRKRKKKKKEKKKKVENVASAKFLVPANDP